MTSVHAPDPTPPASPYAELCGLRWVSISEQEVRAEVPVAPQIMQPAGLVHGGLYASVAEAICVAGTLEVVREAGQTAVGLTVSSSFLRPITAGTVHARATRRHGGRTLWLWDVDITDDAERSCALVRVTIAVR